MKGMKRQQGMTAISLALVLGLIALLTMVVLKLLPVYIENFNVKTSLNSLADGGSIETPLELRNKLKARFDINNVSSVDNKAISILREGDDYIIDVKYEVRRPFLFNVDFVLSFNDSVTVRAR